MIPAFRYPEAWKTTRLRSVLDSIQYGYTESAVPEKVGPKFLRITDLEGGPLNWSTIPHCICKNPIPYLLASGDLVIARTGATTGKSHLLRHVPEAAVFASYLIRLRCSPSLDAEFLNHFLQSGEYWRQICSQSYGTAQPGANASVLSKLIVPLPQIQEQQSIARVLDAVDVAIERTRTAIAKAERLKRGLIQAFIENGLGRISSADKPGRFLRKGWRLAPTRELLVHDPKNGISPISSPQPPGVPTFSIAAVRDGKIDLMNEEHRKYVRIRDEVAAKFAVRRGDLLVVRGNANPELVGRCGMVGDHPERCIYPDILKRIIFRDGEDGVLPEFACIAWNHPVVHNQVLKRAKTSNGTLKINNKDVKQIILPVPPKPEQEQLVNLVGRAERSLQDYQQRAKQLERLKHGLMQDLLTGRVRVKLPTSDGNGDAI